MSSKHQLIEGKRGVIVGIANQRSLAWGIAKTLVDHGARLVITYPTENFKKKLEPLVRILNSSLLLYLNVEDEGSIDALFAKIKEEWGTIDFLVHSIAFSDKNELTGPYLNTSLANFLKSMNVSCYSFTALAQRATKIMPKGSSLLTISYYGAEKVIPHYNVMGLCKAALEASVRYLACDLGPHQIRVNAISAGPIRTLASSGIGEFNYILKWNQSNSPLKRNTTIEDVGGAALYLISELASGTTGEIIHVDSGYNIIGMKMVNEEN